MNWFIPNCIVHITPTSTLVVITNMNVFLFNLGEDMQKEFSANKNESENFTLVFIST